VAGYGPDDIARLLADSRVIRSRVKIEAIIDNAQELVELADEHRGFRRYLRSHGGFAETVADLKRQFRYIGDSGAYHFLWSVNEPVPPYEEWLARPNAPEPVKNRRAPAHHRELTCP
jgi:3-methyladenine DNA glycosylase Tag